MKSRSHFSLGRQLAGLYMPGLGPAGRAAFLLGCVEPDCNPTTYLKGTVRVQRLRGHNFTSAQRCVSRLSAWLAKAKGPSLLYCYRLGKLTHYMADAFTWPHNKEYGGGIGAHRGYEASLQPVFLTRLARQAAAPAAGVWRAGTVYEGYLHAHNTYMGAPRAMETDCDYALRTITMAVSRLWAEMLVGGDGEGRKERAAEPKKDARTAARPDWAAHGREAGL